MFRQLGRYEDILTGAFKLGYSFSDEELKAVNLSFIAYNYTERIPMPDSEKEGIAQRMAALYGEDWGEGPEKVAKKLMTEHGLTHN